MSKYADENQLKLHTKFPSTHFLSNPKNVDHVLLWNTFFRRNLHRLAIDYLRIKLHLYQAILLYLMGISQFIVIIACRAAAKSFIIGLYACCRCITRPYTKIVISSATKKQSKLIVSEKIKNELMNMSPPLRREIKDIKDSLNETIVYFRNGSTITVVPASENGRGNRSHCCIREEFRQIDKSIDDSILSPFQTVRQAPYMINEPYNTIKELKEEPVDIYISSSWFDNGHWMWNIVDQACKDMLDDKFSCLLAFDESITLKHNIRTLRQLKQEKKKLDALSWRIEYLNERVKENTSAFFTYSMLTQNQRLKQVFYPRLSIDYKSNKKNKYFIPKLPDEIRIISCDIAFVAGTQNDNSVYSCIRAIPESVVYETGGSNKNIEIKNGYRREVPYLESNQIGDTTKQAIRIRQLYEDFEADYIVLDTRNGGIQILYSLQKVLYDEERGVEYQPLKCMNNSEYAKVCQNPNAKECIFVINATSQLNSDIAINFRKILVENKIDFLINYSTAKEEILSQFKEYVESNDPNEQVRFEMPFLNTQLMINECAELQYEKLSTGVIRIKKQGLNKKDRYTSVSYGSYFIDQLEKDLIGNSFNYDYSNAPRCVSSISF